MNANDRARMRETLRSAIARAHLPDAGLDHPGAIQAFRPAPDRLLDRFRAQLTALGGDVHDADTAEAVADLVALLAATEMRRMTSAPVGGNEPSPADAASAPSVLMWHADQLPLPGVDTALSHRGLRLRYQTAADMSSVAHRNELASAVVGVTSAQAGLAETGSLVLASGPGRSRLASLLPPIHVALLDRRLVVESLADLMATRPELMTAGANVVCITGPSRTADIEHTLTRGVHGPREVHVVLVH